MGNSCRTIFKGSSNRYECSNTGSPEYPSLSIVEELFPGVTLRRACLCDVNRVVNIMSYTSKLSIIFNVPHMTPRDDYSNYFFEGEYEVIPGPQMNIEDDCHSERRKYDIFGMDIFGMEQFNYCRQYML